jgi:GT2 family glycosyltransferase
VSDSASSVTVAIATYNGRDLLATVLASLERQSVKNFRVVVVDDASTDGTGAWLAGHWPSVELIEQVENRGVTATLNRCLEARGDSEFVLLLNNDVELEEHCIEELVGDMRAHAEAAAAQAKLLDFTRRELLDGAGDNYSWAGLAHRRGQGEQDSGQYDELREVFAVCAAAAIYRSSALERVGPFDDQLYAYCEDTDWAFRARLAGFTCRFVPEARVFHIGSASLGPRVSDFTLYQNWRNQIWVVVKNYPRAMLVRHLPDLAIGVLATLYVAIRRDSLRVWLRAWRDALKGLRAVLGKRRAIQAARAPDAPALDGVIDSAWSKLRWWLVGSGRATAPTASRQPGPPREPSRR